VDTTFAQAQALAGQLQRTELPHGSLVVVSDAYHLRRSRWVVAHYLGCCFEGPEVGLKTAATVPLSLEAHRRWWRDGGQRRWVVRESQKLVFYWLYYGLLGQRRSWDVPVDSVFDWLGLASCLPMGVWYTKFLTMYVAFETLTLAYIGPGMAVGTAIIVLGLALAFLLLLIALVWYPIQTLFFSKEQEEDEDDPEE
jgi:hypothetical protein